MRHSRTTHGIAFVLLFSVFPYIYNLIICTITMGSIRQSLIGSSTLKTDWRISAERDLRNYKGKNIYREQIWSKFFFTYTVQELPLISCFSFSDDFNYGGRVQLYHVALWHHLLFVLYIVDQLPWTYAVVHNYYFSQVRRHSFKAVIWGLDLSLTSCVINSSIYNFLSKNFRAQVVSMIAMRRQLVTVVIIHLYFRQYWMVNQMF